MSVFSVIRNRSEGFNRGGFNRGVLFHYSVMMSVFSVIRYRSGGFNRGGFNRGVLFHYSVMMVSGLCYQKQIWGF